MRSRLPMLATVLVSTALPAAAATITGTRGTSVSTALFPGASTQVTYDAPDGALVASHSGGTLNVGAQPGDGNFGAVYSGLTETVIFSTLLDYVGVAWGTPDSYNGFALYRGTTLIAGAYTGDVVTSSFTNILADSPAQYFDTIVFTSAACCFEHDNIAVRAAPADAGIPEPGSLALVGAGLGLLGLARRYA